MNKSRSGSSIPARPSSLSRVNLGSRPAFLKASIYVLSAAICLIPSASVADVLSQYTFGTAAPASLNPTTQSPNVTAGAIPNPPGAGITLDLSSSQTPTPPSSPWLRVVPTVAASSGADAVAKNAYFQFSLTANAGYLLNLASLVFDVMRGGAGNRGYEVRTSIDNYAATVQTGTADTQRPTFTNITVPLTGAAYQGISTITFRVYSYANGTGSVEYDNLTVNGLTALLPFSGYTWTGTVNGNWNTSTANWAGTGTTYVDGTAGSQVMFNDAGTNTNVNVTPASLNPSAVFFDNTTTTYSISGSSLTVTNGLSKAGTSTVTLNNTITAGSVSISAGSLIVGATGLLTSPNMAVVAGGSLEVLAGGSLGPTSAVQVNGNLSLNNGAQTLAGLGGVNTGTVALTDTTLTVTGSSTFSGAISGSGGIVKSTGGTLVLSGNNTFAGGVVVNGGTLQLDSVTAPGSGAILVNAGASLNLGANITNLITIAGGTLGSSAAGLAVPATVIVTANSTVKTYNAGSGAGSNDVILSGPLLGTGDINLLSLNGNAPDSQAFRLRGPSSDYSGTITVNQSAKFELQNGGATGSPMGTGTLVMVGGTPTGTAAAGTFSLVNLRNNSGGTTTFGNNVRISGAGSAFFNMVGSSPAGSLTAMGDLQIGSGQTAAAVSTAAAHTLGFSTVTLTGGVATFTPQIAGNTNYIAVNNIQLGAISETTPGSGITMNGVATLTLTGANTYTGSTSLLSGTTVLASGASLNNTSSITVAQSAAFNTQAVGTFAVGTIQSLTVNGTLTGSVSIAGALRGSGIVNGTVASITGGLVAPGNSAGTLTTKNLDLGSGSGLQMELSKLIAGSPPIAGLDYDQIVATDDTFGVSPTVTLGANLVLTVGTGVQVGDVFTLILNQSADDVVGTFEGLAQGQVFTAGGQQFRISYGDNAITPAFELSGGNDVSLIVVPEPASAALLLGGGALISASRRRSKCTATR